MNVSVTHALTWLKGRVPDKYAAEDGARSRMIGVATKLHSAAANAQLVVDWQTDFAPRAVSRTHAVCQIVTRIASFRSGVNLVLAGFLEPNRVQTRVRA